MTIVINQRIVRGALVVAVVGLLGWLAWNKIGSGRTIIGTEELTALDPDNAGINIAVMQPWLCDTVLVFDVRPPQERDYDRFDVARCLMQCAQRLKADSTISRVYLAESGRRLYYIGGDDFRSIGSKYDRNSRWGTTMLATTIPTVARTLNDSLAFEPNHGMLAPVNDAANLNTLVTRLMNHESQSKLKQLAEALW